MWDHKEGCLLKNWCFWTVVLEKILESPFDSMEIKPVNQTLIFIGRTDAAALILWPFDAKNWLIGKDPDAGKDWRQEEKGRQRDGWLSITNSVDMSLSKLWEIVKDREGWCAVCSSWGRNELYTTQWLNNNNNKYYIDQLKCEEIAFLNKC